MSDHEPTPNTVIPAQAGIRPAGQERAFRSLPDPRLRGDDDKIGARTIIIIGTILGLTSVLIGAMTDHALDSWGLEHRVQTALHYQQLYAVLIVALGLTGQSRWSIPAALFIAGTLMFSGGLYFSDLVPMLVYLAPVGGLLLMAGWVLLAVTALKRPFITQGTS